MAGTSKYEKDMGVGGGVASGGRHEKGNKCTLVVMGSTSNGPREMIAIMTMSERLVVQQIEAIAWV